MRLTKLLLAAVVGWVSLVGCAKGPQQAQAQAAPVNQAVQQAGLRLPAVFSDNMVLQRNFPAPVWGWAEPGEKVVVTLLDQTKTAWADNNRQWLVKLDELGAGGPYELTVTGQKSTITFKNVLVGEVWVCSGQSNMEWSLRASQGVEEAVASARNPRLRLFTVSKAQADTPLTDCKGAWVESSPETVPGFSGVAFFFGRDLQNALGIPVGLIHTSWGGTPVEAWTSVPVQQRDPDMNAVFADFDARKQKYDNDMAAYQQRLEQLKAEQEKALKEGKPAPAAPNKPGGPGWKPGVLYNAMICPILPYGIAGAIWYQGESNAGQAVRYRKQFPAMIQNWRSDFRRDDASFLFVQLANYMKREEQPADPDWAWLREAQTMTLSLRKTGMAVIMDIGQANDIHPRNKLDVGKRLSLAAQGVSYARTIVYSGPMYDSMKVDGDKVRLTFKHIGGGLVVKDGPAVKGFAMAGADKKFVWADAKIDGDAIIVSSKDVPQPVAVRYAWANNPECNLYNQEGLPASPFRTDDWPKAAK